jgi:hypothetical protein
LRHQAPIVLAVLAAAAGPVLADGAPVGRHLMVVEYAKNRLVELGADGRVLWEHHTPSDVVMFRRRPDGRIVYAYGGKPTGVQEVDRDHTVLWNYVSPAQQVLGFDTLPDGHVLLGEQGPCRAVEVDGRSGKVVRAIDLRTSEPAAHRQVRSVHKLSDGHILACHEGEAVVREYDATGKVVWEYGGVRNVFEALRLPDGHTLISSAGSVREVTRDGRTVWELAAADAPELELTWPTSLQRLPGGNLVVADFKGGHARSGAHAFEVTRDKRVVWRWTDRSLLQAVTAVEVLP